MLINNKEYFPILEEIKVCIKIIQYKTMLDVNCELINLNWNIERIIIANTKYSAKFVKNLSKYIKQEFPNLKGYSSRNLKYMRKFAKIVNDEQKYLMNICGMPSKQLKIANLYLHLNII